MGNEMMEAYLYEMDTLLEQLDSLVMEAESEQTFSQEQVNETFRIMHTIKGSSAMMEFSSLMTIAHRIEDLFFVIRDKGMDVVPENLRPELFDLLFQSIDFFRVEVEKLKCGKPLTDSIGSFLANINSFAEKISGEQAEEGEQKEAAEQLLSPAESAWGSAEFPCGLRVVFDEDCGMENVRAMLLLNAVKECVEEGEFDFLPADLRTNPDSVGTIAERGFLLRFRTPEGRELAAAAAGENPSVRCSEPFDYVPPVSAPEEKPAQDEKRAEEESSRTAPAAQRQSHGKDSLLSVSLSKLDALQALVGEIIITEAQVTASPDLRGLKLENFEKAAHQLRALTDSLQEIALSLRMVSVSATFQKQKRTVRDMCRKLGKDCELILRGEDTEIDKTIVDTVADPIMHIVRNSMDHGIEDSREERIAAGKDPTGQIILSARQAGGEVIIEITDDGRGADDRRILQKAIDRGLARPDTEYDHQEILDFLMAPGFSTNAEVTEFSGRGVGMDVVKSNVESVGGTVSITSEKGMGMTTTLRIPLTTSILDGMEVSAGGSIFTVPLSDICQILRVTDDQVIRDPIHGEMIQIMDRFCSVVRASDFFGLERGAEHFEDGILLWVGSGERLFCLFVDQLIGEQQVVVKPLPDYINRFGVKERGITGCSVLGDGSISLILDVASIYENRQ